MKKLVFILLFIVSGTFLQSQILDYDTLMNEAKAEIYNNPDKAIKIGTSLLKKEKQVQYAVAIYMMLSKAHIAKRDYDQSLDYILKAKDLAQKSTDVNLQIGVLVSLAIQYQQMELYSKSLETLDLVDESLSKITNDHDEKFLETARSLAIRGMIYKNQSNSEIALSKFLKSIENFEKVSDEKLTFANKSVVFYNIGYCYLEMGKIDLAEKSFLHAIDFAQKNKANSLEAFALKGLAEVDKQKGLHQNALELLEKAKNLGQEIGDLTLNEGIYKELSENYLALGNQKRYQDNNKKYVEMRFQREQNELTSINHSINNTTKETQLKIEALKKESQIYFLIICLLGLLGTSILSFLIMKIYRKNQKIKTEIQTIL